MIKRLFSIIKEFFTFLWHFNFILAFKLVIIPILLKYRPEYDRFKYKHFVTKKYLKKRYRKTINSFRPKQNKNKIDPSFAENYPVWFLWWQGEETMSKIVKVCYKTLLKHANGHKVILVTKDNYRDYISLPEYIIKKVEKGYFNLTNLSDVLRMCLLYEHGGLWLDSTVLVTKPLSPLPPICSHLGYWTPKDDGEIIESCFGAKNWIIREGRWLAFCFYSSKGNFLVEFVRAMFFEYIRTNNFCIDHFYVDYFTAIGYDTFPEIRVMVDSVPANNPKVHELYHRLNLSYEYNETLFNELCLNTHFHKLNWKEEHSEYTHTGKLSLYGYIINNYPPE